MTFTNAELENESSLPKGVLVFVRESRADVAPGPRALLAAFWRDRWLHCAILLVCIAGALAYILFTPKVYRAQVVVLPVSYNSQTGLLSDLQSSSLGGLAGLAGIDLGANDDFRKEALALLSSRDFAVRFITDEDLIPALFPERWDPKAGAWTDPAKAPTLDDALYRFDREVRGVSEDRRNGLTQVSMEWHDRAMAARWANAYVARANSELRRRTMEDSERSLDFLRRELDKTNVTELQQTLFRLMETEMRKITLASVRQEYAFRVIDAAREPMAEHPVRPRPALALFLALALASLVIVWIAALRSRSRIVDPAG